MANKIKVCKFGGTSMADASTMQRCADIIRADEARRFIVVSAPGKSASESMKVTDALISCYKEAKEMGSCKKSFRHIRERFLRMIDELDLDLDIERYLDEVEKQIPNHLDSVDFAASRGEYLSAIVFAALLGMPFVDASEIVYFDKNGNFEAEYTNDRCFQKLAKMDCAVIPGFYGVNKDGEITTFSRGGSDITGAIVARALRAEVYENWTDVNGFLVADPRVVDTPHRIKELTYRELRELSYMGASVLHADAIFPVKKVGIPINIRNTFDPERSGTMIVANREHSPRGRVVTGIAGKKHFSVIHITKSMMNTQVGFMRRILSVLEYHDLSCDHMPSGIDTLSVVIDATGKTKEELDQVVNEISAVVQPDEISVLDGISLVATVGHGMLHKVGTAARIFTALARHNVNIRMIDQGASELSIIVGVVDEDYETCVQALYEEFFM